MDNFKLDPRLAADCHVLGRLIFSQVLLLNKAEVPWFVLVPQTSVIELCDLTEAEQRDLMSEINVLSRFIRAQFAVSKLNVAALGNMVPQLHVHVIGRHRDDAYWPGAVWGQPSTQTYDAAQVAATRDLLVRELSPAFTQS